MDTPTHYHIPVMADAVVALLAAAPAGIIVDGTLGGGGHAAALLNLTGDSRPFIGIDQDREALSFAESRLGQAPVTLIRGNFRNMRALLSDALGPEAKVAGILVDLGVSSWQLDAPHRGFAFRHQDAPIDMRMNADEEETALDLIGRLDKSGLARILREFGEVKQPGRIAAGILQANDEGRLKTTADLAREVESATLSRHKSHHKRVHPATQVFQALRIALNDELGALEQLLADAPDILMDGGRLVVMSYHSLEDRRVKHAFVDGENPPPAPRHMPPPIDWLPTWQRITRKPLTPSPQEITANPRARSVKVRCGARAPRATPTAHISRGGRS
ncbi:MAG: 16S rRNA (cytosine1402-N4)-methyltransferase [Myxococcota bacterium]|jgi:16S rRNA (cytosine1402-N4)-methyltransferase